MPTLDRLKAGFQTDPRPGSWSQCAPKRSVAANWHSPQISAACLPCLSPSRHRQALCRAAATPKTGSLSPGAPAEARKLPAKQAAPKQARTLSRACSVAWGAHASRVLSSPSRRRLPIDALAATNELFEVTFRSGGAGLPSMRTKDYPFPPITGNRNARCSLAACRTLSHHVRDDGYYENP